jgi:cytoskeletal protein CcmA (bactofilin family)
MFNRDGIFGKKDDQMRKDSRNVNLTPSLQPAPGVARSSAPEATRPEPQVAEPPKPAQASEDGQGSKLIVGPDIKLKGVEITDCDTLVVEGRVEASMDSRVIKIAEHGVFSGTVGIDVAEIRGRFEGELTARKHLIIYASGRVSGTIRYGKITIEEGGELSGNVATLGVAAVAPAKSASISSTSASASADIMTAYDPFAHKAKAGKTAGAL